MGYNSTGEAAEVQAGASDPVPAMARYFGRMDVFNLKEEEWLTYIERLEMFFVVNSVPKDKKAASLLTLMGGKMYALLKSLTSPTKPTEIAVRGYCGSHGETCDTETAGYR